MLSQFSLIMKLILIYSNLIKICQLDSILYLVNHPKPNHTCSLLIIKIMILIESNNQTKSMLSQFSLIIKFKFNIL